MQIVKRLHIFVLKTFLPLFAMTFFIVLFIVLMQFLWKYIDDLVGKGLGMDVLGELFFYAAVTLVPMALPLAILLASLMTFGNLGEKFELTAMKAAGISLLRAMAPLIILISGIAVGAFYFQNNVLPKAQVKMWTLLFSMKQKSPELEIPEGVFYDQIPGYNLFVQSKNMNTGILRGVMIYDVSQGYDKGTILRADSARLAFTKDMRHLYLHLWYGEQFDNLQNQNTAQQNVPFRRETFKEKEILIQFDANFNRLSEEGMRKQYVGKNIDELQQTIDSVQLRVDSVGNVYADYLRRIPYGGVKLNIDGNSGKVLAYKPVAMPSGTLSLDSLLAKSPAPKQELILQQATQSAESQVSNAQFKIESMKEDWTQIRRHEIELMKKFTLSVACLIFFFIGAPLGAIIRKGGLGTPLVISVILFIIYYIIDNTGYKMARDGHWPVVEGMWISTVILAPLGIYVTWKAMNDSAVFNPDAWRNLLHRLTGKGVMRKVEYKEVIINDISTSEALHRVTLIETVCSQLTEHYKHPQFFIRYWLKGMPLNAIGALSEQLDDTVEYLTDCRDKSVVAKLFDYPLINAKWIYHPARRRWLSIVCMALFPLSIPVWLMGAYMQHRLLKKLHIIIKVSESIKSLLDKDEAEADTQNVPAEEDNQAETAD
ncbi:MAG: LptF/LptG family permease [Muribaculaceae bacterium]|nr:LptF/LptG family permease [Muribaculaceae bacterium]